MNQQTYPAAYAAWLRGAAEHDGEQVTESEIAVEVAHRVLDALGDAAFDPAFPPSAALITLMGGADYVRAVVAWNEELVPHRRKSRDLPAPALPAQ